MKRTFLMLSMIMTICGCGICWSQGTLNFANAGVGVNAPIWHGLTPWEPIYLCSGPDWVAGLWYGPAGAREQDLTPHPVTATFSTIAAQAGYFFGGARTIDTIAGGAVAVVQVRVWNIRAGATWDEAMGSGLAIAMGGSPLFNVTLATPPAAPSNLVGLQGFTMLVAPEPTTAALLVVGGLAFAMRRRIGGRAI